MLATTAILLVVAALVGYFVRSYFQQWGDWVEVANYDFTSPAASVTPLSFRSAWSASGKMDPFVLSTQGLALTPQAWCELKEVRVRGDVRVVMTISYPKRPDGVELCVNSAPPAGSLDRVPEGYYCQYGGYRGRVAIIGRNDAPRLADVSNAVACTVESNHVDTLVFEHADANFKLTVNGKLIEQSPDLLPLTGQDLDRISIRSWGECYLKSLKVYRRALPPRANPVVAGDALVQAGDLSAATETYGHIADDYSRSPVGERALAMEYLLQASPANPAFDSAAADQTLRHFRENYPDSPYRQYVMERQAALAWEAAQYDSAIASAEQVLTEFPESRVAMNLLTTQQGLDRRLPLGIGSRLLHIIGKTRHLVFLDIHGLGISSLDSIRGLKLQFLICADNHISSLEPLRGMPLINVNCCQNPVSSLEPLSGCRLEEVRCDTTQVDSLEPLRGMPVTLLSLSRTPVRSIEPISRCPLIFLDASRTQVSDISPLSGMVSLAQLCLDGLPLRSLLPLRQLQLKWLSVSNCKVADLSPLGGMPLVFLNCNDNQIADLRPLAHMHLLRIVQLAYNQIANLRPLQESGVKILQLQHNRISDLTALGEMHLDQLDVTLNPLATLSGLKANPPVRFDFGDEAMSDQTLADLYQSWSAQPATLPLANRVRAMQLLRRHDVAGLKSLVVPYGKQKVLLLIPRYGTFDDAQRLATALGGQLDELETVEESKFIGQKLLAGTTAAWIGDVAQGGEIRTVSGRPVKSHGNLVAFDQQHMADGPLYVNITNNWGRSVEGIQLPFVIAWPAN